ncbi:hypothetical protein [Streptomyces olivoreticuli]|uniref:hypothetical protein n=1 Tax=Streptomyces olivoreticuli TaxID=68246 RepID=UPI000E27BCC4|nr:hypothetical protein [Streptomyces olivoreticuli]
MGSGRYAVDTRTNRLGERMGSEGPYVQLRPVGGGREWDCPSGKLREPTEAELKKAAVLDTPVGGRKPRLNEPPPGHTPSFP